MGNGAKSNQHSMSEMQSQTTTKRPDTSIAGNIPRNIRSLSKAIGYAAWLDTEAAWHGLTIVLLARLTEAQRASLAFASMKSLSEENAYLTASVAMFGTLDGEALK